MVDRAYADFLAEMGAAAHAKWIAEGILATHQSAVAALQYPLVPVAPQTASERQNAERFRRFHEKRERYTSLEAAAGSPTDEIRAVVGSALAWHGVPEQNLETGHPGAASVMRQSPPAHGENHWMADDYG